MGEPRTVRLGPDDNAVVALDEIREGQRVVAEDVVARATIPAGHKMATATIEAGKPVRKFGQIIGQVASGANVICFTTGRGSAFGFKPAPSIKLATNTAMYERLVEDMDINCGTIADGKQSVDEVGREVFARILAVAGGEKSKSEELDYGDNEFVPWNIGTVM
ncbi:MAG: UxaA family hydrolase [Proteobacteria bacterium]|nr:UxaA family hydrolase [Pseudomonadota bacterium]